MLPKVLKARPLQIHPPSTELPDSESSETDGPDDDDDDWGDVGDKVRGNSMTEEYEPAREAARNYTGRKRERPRDVAGPSRVANSTATTMPDKRGRDDQWRRRDDSGTSVVDGAKAAAAKSVGFEPKNKAL